MIPVGLFTVMMFLMGGTIFILFFNLIGMHQRVEDQKEKVRAWNARAHYWNSQYEKVYRDYLIALKRIGNNSAPVSSTGSKLTWKNIMGFPPESKPNKLQIDSRYKALAKVYHPDLGGSNYAMKLLNLAKEKADKSV